MRTLGKVMVSAGAGAALALGMMTPAVAASSSCRIQDRSCVSGSVPRSGSGQVIYEVQAAGGVRCYYTVRDTLNNNPVAYGSTTTVRGPAIIGGLTNRYRIELSSGSQRAVGCYGDISS